MCGKEKYISGYIDGELPTEDRERVQKHIEVCEVCHSIYHNLAGYKHFIMKYVPEEMSGKLSGLFYDKLEEKIAVYERTLAEEKQPVWSWEAVWALLEETGYKLGLAVFLLVVMLGIDCYGRGFLSMVTGYTFLHLISYLAIDCKKKHLVKELVGVVGL